MRRRAPHRTTSDSIIDLPLACVPGAIPAHERPGHFLLLRQLFTHAVREKRAHAHGIAYRFDADAFDDLVRWMSNERRCCPFLTFHLELSANEGPIWLRLSGPTGTDSFLDAELRTEAS